LKQNLPCCITPEMATSRATRDDSARKT